MRLVTTEIGCPLDGVHSLHKFLCAMYDSCAVQRNLYRKSRIIHRDISDNNIMFAPGTETYRQRNQKGYADVKFINQVLAKDRSVEPDPACLVINLGNGADLTIERGTDVLKEQTGTPKFIARSVSSGELLDYPSSEVTMPRMDGQLADYEQFMHTSEYRLFNNSGSAESEVEFAHRLFHDAESTFWVIAWTLARSIKAGSEEELEPHARFTTFFYIMSRHYPTLGNYDPRLVFSVSEKHWESILHPDLVMLAPMLSRMFNYIQPEWAYRPQLNAEHVHEALMRLLLAQIVMTTREGTNFDIDIGGRNAPPPPEGEDPLTQSMTNSRSKSGTLSQATRSTEPQTSIIAGASGSVGSPKTQNKSDFTAPDPSALSQRMEDLKLGSRSASGNHSQRRDHPGQTLGPNARPFRPVGVASQALRTAPACSVVTNRQ
ncbi:unnamed protein product [Rhizoctonia solani]|uniref:Fungal-type protein kinase domain-containing protein n=1 Tax=Rhizoctonia solani TaxID=456999 RepID=A0A8H3EEK6_9AGAM|nr:unnamed protein product [Rhizoctonia solani]CAE7232487.1 unnamed protein product [Rhizoctonia solani]